MKKAKSLFFCIIVITLLLQPVSIFQNNFVIETAYAKELTKKILKVRRESFFSRSNSLYSKKKKNIKILIVPGHDDINSGTEHNGVREVDLNRKLSSKIYNLLSDEPGFEVVLASDQNGYNQTLIDYFNNNEQDINKFITSSKEDFNKKIKDEGEILEQQVYHNSAPADAAFKLYGINKWVNENKFDFVIHIHFNDYGGRRRDANPRYSGFSIYIPGEKFPNHKLSVELAESIFEKLKNIVPPSDNEIEAGGIIKDYELIAVGAHETLDAASILIEYGYIYEPHYTDSGVSELIMDELAKYTYTGVKNFFGEDVYLKEEKHIFTNDLFLNKKIRSKENFMLQKTLAMAGYYPPEGKSLNECPISGLFGPCTQKAIIDFQNKKGIPTTGYVGSVTLQALNSL